MRLLEEVETSAFWGEMRGRRHVHDGSGQSDPVGVIGARS